MSDFAVGLTSGRTLTVDGVVGIGVQQAMLGQGAHAQRLVCKDGTAVFVSIAAIATVEAIAAPESEAQPVPPAGT